MTTDVKLLPLPEWAACDETVADMSTTDVREAMADYARANMEPLIAENERLRAQYQQAAESSEHFAARAERLAEALRGGVTMLERLHGELGPCEAGDSVWDVRDSLKGALASAALDQEGGISGDTPPAPHA